jgi:glycosyltransferase involved in cell wall biosynthesis
LSERPDPPHHAPFSIAVLIPALNEEEALPGVLGALHGAGLDRVVVVDNGSTDGTARVARDGGAEVVSQPERGYGAACLAGIQHLAAERPPDILVFMDGDQSDDPAAISLLLEPIERGRADFVVGVRSGADSSSAVPLHARLGNRLVGAGAMLLHGLRFRDLGPFRAIRFEVLRALDMDDRNWGWTLQMQLRAHRMGVPTAEVPVPHRPRGGGRSKVSGNLVGSVRAGGKMLYTLVSERLRARPNR